jgi:DNA-3-methyladenine glycosylase
MMNGKKIRASFFTRDDTPLIARELIGKSLVVPAENGIRVSGMIVETEAYLGIADRAAHSFGGKRTGRTEIMYAEGGHVYIFLVYGMHHQLNFVTGPADHPHAILIRAVEPYEGIEIMRKRRGKMGDRNLTSGPGKLCKAFAIDKTFNGAHLEGGEIWVEEYRKPLAEEIAAGTRIGIDYAGEDAKRPWRFWLKDNIFVSR